MGNGTLDVSAPDPLRIEQAPMAYRREDGWSFVRRAGDDVREQR